MSNSNSQAKSIYLISFDFDTFKNNTFKNNTFKNNTFKKNILIAFLDELGNFKPKNFFYTFDFYTFKRGKVDRLRLKTLILAGLSSSIMLRSMQAKNLDFFKIQFI